MALAYHTAEYEAEARAALTRHPRSRIKPARRGQELIGWILFLGLSIALFFLLRLDRSGTATEDALADVALTPRHTVAYIICASGITLFLGGWLLIRLAMRREVRRLHSGIRWAINDCGPSLVRPGKTT